MAAHRAGAVLSGLPRAAGAAAMNATDIDGLMDVLYTVATKVVVQYQDTVGYAVFVERIHNQKPEHFLARWAVQDLLTNGFATQNAAGRVFITDLGQVALVRARLGGRALQEQTWDDV